MKDIIFSCPTLAGELETALKEWGNDTPVKYLPKELHADPAEMNRHLQNLIDKTEGYDRIILCVSACGGSTKNLKARNCPVVIPKTADCIDILLSGGNTKRERQIYLTKNWMEFMKGTSLDLNVLTESLGEEAAKAKIREIFDGFPDFNIIETGTYDTKPVEEFIQPVVDAIDGGTLKKVEGPYSILHKIAKGEIDNSFRIIEV